MNRPVAFKSAQSAREQAASWWRGRTPRERRLLASGACALALALFWALGLKPAVDSIARSQQQLPRLHAEAAQLDALILEAQTLQRRVPGQADTKTIDQALLSSLERVGLKGQVSLTALDTAHPEWEVRVANAAAAELFEWLSGLPSVLEIRVTRVELTRSRLEGRDQPGQVSGYLLLQGQEPTP